jgi:UDP-GlcNAc3NAcA epimerase
MLDTVRAFAPVALERSRILERLGLEPGAYLVATLHRAENTPAETLGPLLAALAAVGSARRPLILPMHPRTAHVIRDAGLALPAAPGLRAIDPLGYLDMIALVARAHIVLTDSGGLQKEAFFLGRPCVTLREQTEWVETVSGGGNVIAGTSADSVCAAVDGWDRALQKGGVEFSSAVTASFGDGRAAARIVAQTLGFLGSRSGG